MHTGVSLDPRRAALCTAHKRKTGERCRAIAVKGSTKCKFHGGRSISGVAHPSYKTGRYSKVLPEALAARAEQARTNPRLLSLDDDIATNEARLATLFAGLEAGDVGAPWQALRQALDAFSAARATGNTAQMGEHFAAMQRLVTLGADQLTAWEEIRKHWELGRKLKETEVKTLHTMQQMVTAQQMMLVLTRMVQTFAEAVKAHADPAAARTILQRTMEEFTTLSTFDGKG